jgi:transposase-like protein
MDSPKTLLEAIQYFSDEQVCIDAVAAMRWPNGVVCAACSADKPYYLKTAKRWKCRECRGQFSVKVNSIFEDSPISLTKWLPALWLLVNCKNGVSSYEISRDLGITQKSAWFVLHRLRLALKARDFSYKLGSDGGPVEMDETYVGGKVKNMHASKLKAKKHGNVGWQGGRGKAVVMGILERGGEVRAQVVESRLKKHLGPVIEANVKDGAHIITDEATVYQNLTKTYFHEVINHMEGYVNAHVYTNGIENFWSLLKRGLNGTYVNVEPYHLQAYVEEQVFRFNNRATKDNPLDDADRFLLALSQVANRRLTYAELTGKVSPTQA